MPTALHMGRLRGIGTGTSWVGCILFMAGVVTGWVLPHIPQLPEFLAAFQPFVDQMKSPIDAYNSGLAMFFSAVITALAVIVAILIGYNVAALQIAAQTMSVGLIRAILFTLGLFVLGWIISMGTVLVYLVNPPTYTGQYWQVAMWFAAISLFVLAYMWELPLRLAGGYAARWSFKDLRHTALGDWQEADGFAVLQGGITAATHRGDIVTVRTMDVMLGEFLSGVCDQTAEDHPGFNRDRYWTLYNLLGGCAQGSDIAPSAVPYNLGFVAAGVLLQSVAVGHPTADPRSDVFSALWENVSPTPNYVISLWAGLRYGLCRESANGVPYLLRYWHTHAHWLTQPERLVNHVADGLLRLHQDCWHRLSSKLSANAANEQAAILLAELYRYIGTYLAPASVRQKSLLQWVRRTRPFALLPLTLLDALHCNALPLWPVQQTSDRSIITTAYDTQRTKITNLLSTKSITAPPTPCPE